VIPLRTPREIDLLRKANQIVAHVLTEMADRVAPGVTTGELDALGHALIRESGATPAFLGYRGYPNATCISVDEVIVHGIPGARKLNEGEIVSIDVGVVYEGYFGDAALSVPCGIIDGLRKRLLEATDLALAKGVEAARAGNYLGDVSRAVENVCKKAGFAVVRDFVGHGIGDQMHMEPQIPNFVSRDRGPRLKAGMVLAIEPMVNAGTHRVRVRDDGWTAETADRKPSAHFEHSVVVRNGDAELLSFTPRRIWGVDPAKRKVIYAERTTD
jgi:methionyl aminopeptidase